MKYFLTTIILISFAFTSQAQNAYEGLGIAFDKNYDIKINRDRYEKFEGSPFYNAEWATGQVIFSSGKRSKPVNLKYSTYTNELLFKKDGQLLAVSNNFKGFTLDVEDETITFKKGFSSSEHNISPKLILEVIYDGTVKLLTHHKNNIIEYRSDPLSGEVSNRFNHSTEHFLVDEKGSFHVVDMDDDDILDALGNHKDKLKKITELNELDFDKKSDIKVILKKYDAMIK